MSFYAGGNTIANILATAGGKTGLSLNNKDFMKLSQGGKGGGNAATRSQTGKSQNSRGTRMTGRSGSRRSKKSEFDWEDTSIMEIDVMI